MSIKFDVGLGIQGSKVDFPLINIHGPKIGVPSLDMHGLKFMLIVMGQKLMFHLLIYMDLK